MCAHNIHTTTPHFTPAHCSSKSKIQNTTGCTIVAPHTNYTQQPLKHTPHRSTHTTNIPNINKTDITRHTV